MKISRFRLYADFTDCSVMQWYHAATVGDLALLEIASRACVVELLCCSSGRVLWSVRGGRSLTMTLIEALSRLQWLSTDEPAEHAEAGSGQAETMLLETVPMSSQVADT